MGFVRTTAGVLLTAAARVPVALATSVILARWLSVENRGLYAVAMTVALTTAVFAQLGWNSAAVYLLRRVRAAPGEVVSVVLAAVSAIALLAVGVGWLGRSYLMTWFMPGAPALLLALALAMVPARLLGASFAGVARGLGRFDLSNGYQLGLALGTLGTVAAVLSLFPGRVELVFGWVVGLEWLAAVLLLGWVVWIAGIRGKPAWRWLADGQRFGAKSYLQALSRQLHERIDIFMLAYFIQDPAPIAQYVIAVGVVQQLRLFPDAIASVLFPSIAGLREEQASGFTSRLSRHSVAWVGLMALVLLPSGPFLVPALYGAEYRPAITLFVVLLPGAAFFTVHRVISRYFTAIDRQQVNVATQFAGSFVNVLLNLVLIPRFGVLGAAVASLLSYTLGAVLIAMAYKRATGRGVAETFILGREDVSDYQRRIASRLRPRRSANARS